MKRPLRRLRAVLLVGAVLGSSFAVGCKAKSEPPAGAAPPSLPPSPPMAKAATPALRPILTLGDRLEVERDRKIQGTPKSEDVYAAFERAGLALTEKKQHVAKVFGAQYCLGAKSTGDVAFSVCEYDTPESAAAGRETSRKAFEVVVNRELLINKKTLLTVRQPPTKTAASEAASNKARDIFGTL